MGDPAYDSGNSVPGHCFVLLFDLYLFMRCRSAFVTLIRNTDFRSTVWLSSSAAGKEKPPIQAGGLLCDQTDSGPARVVLHLPTLKAVWCLVLLPTAVAPVVLLERRLVLLAIVLRRLCRLTIGVSLGGLLRSDGGDQLMV